MALRSMMARGWLLGLLAFVLVIAAGSAFAGTVAYKFNGMNVTREGGVTHLRGTSPSEMAAGGATVAGQTINAAGSANWYVGMGALLQNGGVVFNAAVPVASTAATVAVSAIRANPAGLITSAVLSYLISKGLDYVGGQITYTDATSGGWLPANYSITASGGCNGTWSGGNPITVKEGYNSACAPHMQQCKFVSMSGNNAVVSCLNTASGSWVNSTVNKVGSGSCPTGYALGGDGKCRVSRAATDADYAQAKAGPLTDGAAYDLLKNGVALPIGPATFTPPSKDVVLSDPYVDPVTGKRYRDVARVTPQPSAPDVAMVEPVRQEVNANGDPVVENGQPVAAEEKDPCKLHPEASGCAPLDEVPDITIPETSNPFSVNPVSGFGADNASCPADQVLFTKSGQTIKWTWAQVCTFASGMRPLVIGFAWLAAIAMVVAVGRRAG